MRKRIKILIVMLCGMVTLLFISSPNVFASEYDDIQNEVAELVEEGKLPSYHNNLSSSAGYQTFYTKMYRQGDDELKSYFASIKYANLLGIIKNYENKWNSVWYDILTNLDIEPEYLDADRILGLYYDADASENASYLYLIWTSKYLPSEFMTIRQLMCNGTVYSQYPENDLFKPFWYDSRHYNFEQYDLAIHITPIGGYENGDHFGVPMTQKYTFSYLQTGIDKLQFNNDPDPSNKYSATINSDAEFNLGLKPEYHKQSACQLVTHAYQLIKDCEVQSYFDMGFGGYIHLVHFNTSIPIDKIYRVDVSYILSSENKEWYQFWLETDEKRVIKSMKPEKKSTGIFGLYDTYGFKEGTFKSNNKDSISYKYEMMLNYSEQNWDLFGDYCIESNYKKIKDFKILRLNYLINDKTYDVKVTMDSVDGETLSIVDRDLILDTDSTLWQVKDTTYGIIDGVTNVFETIKNVVAITLTVVGFLLVFYVGYKTVISVKEVLEDEKKK
ncbi:MAG: hypothetical protein K6C11_02870 [Bacilli bacterium]|nr:hypothetical protein [Bacilli bacterium]